MGSERENKPSSAHDLLPRVYEQLRILAKSRLKMLPPGQTLEPTALALGISTGTVEREWRYIRAWLEYQLRSGG